VRRSGVSIDPSWKRIVFIKVPTDSLTYKDENFSQKKEIIALSIINEKRDPLTCCNREKHLQQGFDYFKCFKTTDNKSI
jgi:hypothetical protein